jgi:glycosyltransferase involved in cell wall biosynthesis
MSESPVLSIVAPAYNESKNIEKTLDAIREQAVRLEVPYEIVVIDDGSSDDTWPLLGRIAQRIPELRALSLTRNFGKENAIMAGLEIAQGEAIILIDCDLQHPPQLIPNMFHLWRDQGFKVVSARKEDRGRESVVSSLGARLFYGVFDRLAGNRLTGSSDFKLLDREVADVYRRLPERSMFFRGIVPWTGFAEAEVPFRVQERQVGRTRWSFLRRASLAVNALSSFSAIPLQFVTICGILFLVFAIVLGAQTLYQYLIGEAVEGFTTVILLILIASSIIMLSLGILGQYLAKIYEEVKGRPRYLIRDRIRIN